MLHCKLKNVVGRITTHLKHCHATKFVVASWKNLLKKVDACSTCCNMLLQLARTKFGCVTMFEVGGKTCNNAFQLATQQCCVQVEEKCCPYYRAFKVLRIFYIRLRTSCQYPGGVHVFVCTEHSYVNIRKNTAALEINLHMRHKQPGRGTSWKKNEATFLSSTCLIRTSGLSFDSLRTVIYSETWIIIRLRPLYSSSFGDVLWCVKWKRLIC